MSSPWTSLLDSPPAQNVDVARDTALIPLPSLGVITLTGPDSMKFLQGQTTTDFREVEKGRPLPGAICSLKGRVLFSFIALPDGENVALVLPADQIEAALAHLRKYAVFSKTQLEDASARIAVLGVAGTDSEHVLQQLGEEAPQGTGFRNTSGHWLARLFTDDRCLVLLPQESLAEKWPALSQSLVIADENAWWAADIRAGFATVFAATRDLFQPQELNYHALDAVSYDKGCYTGQEVVARLYFRGKLKQRLYRLEAEQPVENQSHAIFAEGAHVGAVVMSATEHDGKVVLLAIVRNAAARAGGLILGESGPSLKVMELPYELPAEKEE